MDPIRRLRLYLEGVDGWSPEDQQALERECRDEVEDEVAACLAEPPQSPDSIFADRGRHAMLVVVPPHVAILGAGRIEPGVAVQDGRPVVQAQLPLSLTFDHRTVTGAEAAHFLSALRADLGRGN